MFPSTNELNATGLICIIDADEVSKMGNPSVIQNLVPAVCAKCGTEGYADSLLVVETQLRLREGKEIVYCCMRCHPDYKDGAIQFQPLSNVELNVIHASNLRELESYGIDLRSVVSEAIRYAFSRHLVVDFQDDKELDMMAREELTRLVKIVSEKDRYFADLYKFILTALENDLFDTQILIQFLWMFPAFALQKVQLLVQDGKSEQDFFELDELLNYCKVRIFQNGRVANKKWGFPIDS